MCLHLLSRNSRKKQRTVFSHGDPPKQITWGEAEFLEFFREFLHSEYDLMYELTVEDFFWLKAHMADADLFNPVDRWETVKMWLSF